MSLKSNFLTYVSIPTSSNPDSPTCPSTPSQKTLGALLVEQLLALGLKNARMDENGYVYATLPANAPAKARVGFIAHMDTSPDAPDSPIQPRSLIYEGGDITLSEGAVLSPADFPGLNRVIGHEIIVTDGKTLLGADDKAGIAIIMEAVKRLIEEDLPHGDVCVGFTPDEEIGRGADLFDVAHFGADYAYTMDGGEGGSLDYENFNAAAARVSIKGFGIHPGSAKGKMKNASLMAAQFISLLPQDETPAHTEGYEGFFHLTDMKGDVESAELFYIIRDHDRARFEARKEQMKQAAGQINTAWGEGSCSVQLMDSYYNMKEIIDSVPYVVDRAVSAMRSMGIEPAITPIRGGTDGARLSYMGLPCPNLGTGGQNYHSKMEFVSVTEMEQSCELVMRICTDLTKDV